MHGRLQHGVRIARLEWDSRRGADRELVMRLLPKLGPRRFEYNELSRGVLCVLSLGAMRQVATVRSLDAGANYLVSDGKAVLTFTTSAIAGQVARVTRSTGTRGYSRYSRAQALSLNGTDIIIAAVGPAGGAFSHHSARDAAKVTLCTTPVSTQ